MNKKLVILNCFFLLILFPFEIVAQNNPDTVFYTKNWKLTNIKDSVGIYGFKNYNSDSIGLAIYYFKDGELNSKQNEKNNLKHGECTWYYKNGNIKSRGNYIEDKREGEFQWWFQSNSIETVGNFKAGKYDGLFVFYDSLGHISNYGVYKEDSLLYSYRILGNDTIYGKTEDFALFNGASNFEESNKYITDFLRKNLSYPRKSQKNNETDKVYVVINISKEGKVTVMDIKGKYPLLNASALETVKKMKKWQPAKVNNKNVISSYSIPINFKLE